MLAGTRLAIATGVLSLLSACVFLIKPEAAQCETDFDCQNKGGAFAQATCDSSLKICTTKQDNVTCTKNADCAEKLGAPAACRESRCLRLASAQCDRVLGKPSDAKVLYLGALLPKQGPAADVGRSSENAIELALEEINAAGGIPLGPASEPHSVAVISCNDGSVQDDTRPGNARLDADARAKAVQHLNDTLKVPAIIGPGSSEGVLDVAKTTIGAGVLMLSPSATAASVGTLIDNDLVWRIPPSDDGQAGAIAAAVGLLDGRLRPSIPTLRMVVVARTDAYGSGLAEAAIPLMSINGAKATDPANASNFRRVDYDPPFTKADVDMSGILQACIALKPHIVVALGGEELTSELVSKLETAWSDLPNPIPPRPNYVLAHAMTRPSLVTAASQSQTLLYSRVLMTEPGRANDNRGSYALRYKAKSAYAGTDPVVFGAPAAYDATYLLAYAAVGTRALPVTGAALGQTLKKMVPPGAPTDVGPNRLGAALQALRNGQTIDFNGAFGPENFDQTSGESVDIVDLQCMEQSGGTGEIKTRSSGRYFDPVANKMLGDFSVPRCAGF